MWTYLLICSWFIVGGVTFIISDAIKSCKTKGDFVFFLIWFSLSGYIGALIILVVYIISLDFWREEI